MKKNRDRISLFRERNLSISDRMEVKKFTTDEKGTLKVMPLSQGTHKLKEVKAPDGYRTNNNELIFQVDESGR